MWRCAQWRVCGAWGTAFRAKMSVTVWGRDSMTATANFSAGWSGQGKERQRGTGRAVETAAAEDRLPEEAAAARVALADCGGVYALGVGWGT